LLRLVIYNSIVVTFWQGTAVVHRSCCGQNTQDRRPHRAKD